MQRPIESTESESKQRRYRIDLEYDGTLFLGWQIQQSGRTVQGVVEEALKQLYGISIRTTGAGRTDAGVHAANQVAHFNAPVRYDPDTLFSGLNHYLPADVRVMKAAVTSADFHARYSARWRWYRYRVFYKDYALERDYGWHPKFDYKRTRLDKVTDLLKGELDFKAFAKENPNLDHYRCNIVLARWRHLQDEDQFHIVGNRFLHHMVRNLAGSMLDVARGRFSVDDFQDIMENRQREFGVYNAPAKGLCLMRVGYGLFPYLDEKESEVQKLPFKL